MDLPLLTQAFSVIQDGLRNIQSAKIGRNERYKDAFLAISTAANQTLAYIKDYEEHKNVDRNKEVQLSSYWDKAAADLMEFEPDLARRCTIKARYWADPTRWSQKQIAEAQIRLSEILKEIDRLRANFPK
jgi:hypothetical protein